MLTLSRQWAAKQIIVRSFLVIKKKNKISRDTERTGTTRTGFILGPPVRRIHLYSMERWKLPPPSKVTLIYEIWWEFGAPWTSSCCSCCAVLYYRTSIQVSKCSYYTHICIYIYIYVQAHENDAPCTSNCTNVTFASVREMHWPKIILEKLPLRQLNSAIVFAPPVFRFIAQLRV